MQPPPLDKQGPTGIGGWLAFFCVILLVISPGANYLYYTETQKSLEEARAVNPVLAQQLADFLRPLTLAPLLMIGVSFVTGIMMLARAPGAVLVAKIVTFIPLLVGIGSLLMVNNSTLPKEVNDGMRQGAMQDIFRGLVFCGIWFTYLCRSVRVKNTYGTGA